MKKSRFTESQVAAILQEGEAGVPELKRLRELEAENAKPKRMFADLALENSALEEVLNQKR